MAKPESKSTLLFTHQKRTIANFLLKSLPQQKIVPNLLFIILKLNAIFVEYSLIGIVNPKITRRNEI